MATLTPPFHADNIDFAYQLHYHIGFRTRRRLAVFKNHQRLHVLRKTLFEICDRNNYHVLECETHACWVRLLLSLRPEHAPAVVARTIKGNSSRWLFEAYPEIEREIGGRSLWSRAYYVRGIGDVTNEIVYHYIARQREHHEFELGDSRELASFADPCPQRFFDLRPWSHCVAEYNCHLVLAPVRHVPAIDASLANDFLRYIRRIASTKRVDVISLAVLEDHVHLFAALRPAKSPRELALAVMNNTWYWIWKRNPGALKLWDAPDFWTHSAFVRTAGAATTNQVRAHLRSGREAPTG